MDTKPYPYELATPEQRKIGTFWWCIHHGVKYELLVEPIECRADYIRKFKDAHEIETRLRAMRPVIGPVPTELAEAYAELIAANEEWRAIHERSRVTHSYTDKAAENKAIDRWTRAYHLLYKATHKYRDEMDALFAKECADVPWGKYSLVFPPPPQEL